MKQTLIGWIYLCKISVFKGKITKMPSSKLFRIFDLFLNSTKL